MSFLLVYQIVLKLFQYDHPPNFSRRAINPELTKINPSGLRYSRIIFSIPPQKMVVSLIDKMCQCILLDKWESGNCIHKTIHQRDAFVFWRAIGSREKIRKGLAIQFSRA